MGLDYALVHLYYNIPPAVLLTLAYRPLFTAIDAYKILFLIAVAVTATIPWDSYLIRNNVWSYPPDAVLGPTLFRIPYEELFFFVIQTYNTSLLYCLLSKPTFHPAYLRGENGNRPLLFWKRLVAAFVTAAIGVSAVAIQQHGDGFYMGLIVAWAGPFVLVLWLLAYQLIIQLPWKDTFVPVALPTLYLWIVDTIALNRGTWVIEAGTKLKWQIWKGLDIEEAVFFLLTNMLIVFGLVAFDNSLAILDSFPSMFPSWTNLPSPSLKMKALLMPVAKYDENLLEGLREALTRLQNKSRSFYVASGVFPSRIRKDLILLYSFCRVADDLVDEAKNMTEAKEMIAKLKIYLDLSYGAFKDPSAITKSEHISTSFPSFAQKALEYLPTDYLSPKPLYELLEGFVTDLSFSSSSFPITDEGRLESYAAHVAGTVARSCIELIYHHTDGFQPDESHQTIMEAGNRMGIALQYVNIARDIRVDAEMNRVYLPTTWLEELGLIPEDVLEDPDLPEVQIIRQRLLDRAMTYYGDAKTAIEDLPAEVKGPMRVTVESYIEIGRTLRKKDYVVKEGRATVGVMRRLAVAWKALS